MLSRLDLLLLLIISLALLVGSIGILNTMLMSTSERTLEFGIMKANGWSRGDVVRLIMAESVLLGLCSGLLGCLLAAAGVSLANPVLDGGLRPILTPETVCLGLALALGLGTVGGVYPAWCAGRLAPWRSSGWDRIDFVGEPSRRSRTDRAAAPHLQAELLPLAVERAGINAQDARRLFPCLGVLKHAADVLGFKLLERDRPANP